MKNRITIASFAIIATFMSACSLVNFDRTPNADKLAEFPDELLGNYNIEGYKTDGDTGYVSVSKTEIEIIDNKISTKIGLSDSIMLFKMEKYFILSVQVEENNQLRWELYPLKTKKDCIYLYPISFSRYKKSLQKYFSNTPSLKFGYQLNDNEFKKFVEKKLRKKYALKLKKLK